MISVPSGKCPGCKEVIRELAIDSILASEGPFQPKWKAATYCCPNCKTVLGAGLDPLALKTDTIDEILQALGRK